MGGVGDKLNLVFGGTASYIIYAYTILACFYGCYLRHLLGMSGSCVLWIKFAGSYRVAIMLVGSILATCIICISVVKVMLLTSVK